MVSKGIRTPSVKHQQQRQYQAASLKFAAWEWVWDQFWSGTMHSNGTLPLTLPLPLTLDARCVYTLS